VGYALVPASQRNDRYAREQAAQRQAIVNTWYSWAQEFFCDAVSLTIGGHATSTPSRPTSIRWTGVISTVSSGRCAGARIPSPGCA
jgi:hypothetical protein